MLGVLGLLVLVVVLGDGGVGQRADYARVDAPLERLAPLPSGAPLAPAPPATRPAAAARAITADLDRRWRAATRDALPAWAPLADLLAPGLVRDLARAPGPPGLALAHALARAAAGEVQTRLGVRQRVDAAAADDPPAEPALRARLVRQAECLAGLYLAASRPPASLTPAALSAALAGRGTDDEWLRRGLRAERPADCAAFARGDRAEARPAS
ncbi:MAG TPA: hypothetical protein VNT51_12895 [Miltoncostaeaceae bacterium]|nr:hypothetical protein [Miltoncostaeaceae bacterium]